MTAEPGRAIARALASATMGTFRRTISAEMLSSRTWASAGLIGVRCRLSLSFHGVVPREVAAAFLEGLAEHEFALPGRLVADLAVVELREDRENPLRLTIEALILEAD